MAYDENNANYQQLTDEEKTLVGIPSEVENALNIWDMEDNGDFETDDED